MMLTVGGGLLLRSFVSVLQVNPGFNAEHLLTMQFAVPARYSGPEATRPSCPSPNLIPHSTDLCKNEDGRLWTVSASCHRKVGGEAAFLSRKQQ
jgi:hypothetical protein